MSSGSSNSSGSSGSSNNGSNSPYNDEDFEFEDPPPPPYPTRRAPPVLIPKPVVAKLPTNLPAKLPLPLPPAVLAYGEGYAPASRRSKPIAQLLSEIDTSIPAEPLVAELLSVGEVGLWHGPPRSYKSFLLLRLLIDLAIGDSPAWGDPRFSIPAPRRVLYFTEEDNEPQIARRAAAMLAGRGPGATHPSAFPDSSLSLVVRKGLDFDTEDGRAAILKEINVSAPELVVFDPLRGFTSACDQGPSELRPVVRFLRYIQRETSASTLLLVHHDAKSHRKGGSRSNRASGGGIWSICDSPVSFDSPAEGAHMAVCHPTGFKNRIDSPEPFAAEVDHSVPGKIRFRVHAISASESASGSGSGSASASASSSGKNDRRADRRAKVIEFIGAGAPDTCTGSAIRTGIGGSPNQVVEIIGDLVEEGLVLKRLGPRGAFYYTLKSSAKLSNPKQDNNLPPQK